jgi:ribosome-associated protein
MVNVLRVSAACGLALNMPTRKRDTKRIPGFFSRGHYKDRMLEINANLRIPKEEMEFSFARSGGPGGQNVQKVSSKVFLRWNPANSPSLPDDVKGRFLSQQHHRLTKEGDLLITSQRTRDQGQNVEDCLTKLREMITAALQPPKKRHKTRPTRGSKERRMQAKKHQARRKAGRKIPPGD